MAKKGKAGKAVPKPWGTKIPAEPVPKPRRRRLEDYLFALEDLCYWVGGPVHPRLLAMAMDTTQNAAAAALYRLRVLGLVESDLRDGRVVFRPCQPKRRAVRLQMVPADGASIHGEGGR